MEMEYPTHLRRLNVERQKENSMLKLLRFLASPALVLVFSFAIFSTGATGAFAQHFDRNAVHSTLQHGVAQSVDAVHPNDGPAPVDTGNGGGRTGYGGWSDHACTSHFCGPLARSIKKCTHLARTDRSNLLVKRQAILACRWMKAERW